jgi:ParB/RepB/Spo0J family partition protein
MRADKHYVEMLDAPPVRPRMEMLAVDAIELSDGGAAAPAPELVESIARHGVLQPLLVQSRNGRYRLLAGRKRLVAAIAAGLGEVPAIIHHAADESAEAIAAATNLFIEEGKNTPRDPAEPIGVQASGELARSLSALGACVNLLGNPAPILTQTVAIGLVRAEVWRAACLLQASRILRGEISSARRPAHVRSILERVLQSMEPERRLRGVVLEQRTNLATDSIDVDEELVVCALSGLLMAVFALTDGHGHARVVVTAESQPEGDVVFGLSQNVASAPLEWVTHVGENETGAVEAGGLTTVAIVAARRIVAACEGRMRVEAGVGGTSIHITVPALPYSAA